MASEKTDMGEQPVVESGKLQFIGKDPITVGAIHESPAVPKRQSVRMFFHYTGDS